MLPQLDPTFFASQLFWLAITFSILYVVLSRMILPLIREVLQDRENRIASDLEKAEAMKNEAEAARTDYMASLEEARKTANQLIADANEAIKKEVMKRHAELDKSLAERIAEAEERINSLEQTTRAQLEPLSIELAQEILGKVLSLKIDEGNAKEALRKCG